MINKSEQAYDKLESMITFRELKPGGMVSESELMTLTGMGRTPVREALQRLSAEKMVEIHPRRGILVPPITVEAQLRLLEVRRNLEEQAVRLATHRSTMAQKERMLQLAEALLNFRDFDAIKEYGALLKETHRTVADAAGNEYLTMAMLPLQGLSRRFWFANIKDVKAELSQAARLHGDVLRAICHGDEQAAGQASLTLNDYLTEFAYHTLRQG